jgi:hypothetical protein
MMMKDHKSISLCFFMDSKRSDRHMLQLSCRLSVAEVALFWSLIEHNGSRIFGKVQGGAIIFLL